MKKIYYALLFAILFTGIISCEKDLHTYEGTQTIYFNETARTERYQGEVLKDSSLLSFTFAKGQDSIVNMVIAVMGAKVDYDRTYKLEVNASSTAVANVHYEILNPTFAIKKNQLLDTVKIKFFRKEDLKENTLILSFDLLENENFSTAMNFKITNPATDTKISFINYRWFISDVIKQPSMWFDAYLGKFTRKKLLLMADVLGIEPSYLDKGASIIEIIAYGKYMQRYLNDKKNLGQTVFEEDGTMMEMGYYVQ